MMIPHKVIIAKEGVRNAGLLPTLKSCDRRVEILFIFKLIKLKGGVLDLLIEIVFVVGMRIGTGDGSEIEGEAVKIFNSFGLRGI